MSTIDPCQSCRRNMRPVHGKLADYPGTVYRQNQTTCQPCGKKQNPTTFPTAAFEAFIDWLETRRVRLGYEDGTMDKFRRTT